MLQLSDECPDEQGVVINRLCRLPRAVASLFTVAAISNTLTTDLFNPSPSANMLVLY